MRRATRAFRSHWFTTLYAHHWVSIKFPLYFYFFHTTLCQKSAHTWLCRIYAAHFATFCRLVPTVFILNCDDALSKCTTMRKENIATDPPPGRHTFPILSFSSAKKTLLCCRFHSVNIQAWCTGSFCMPHSASCSPQAKLGKLPQPCSSRLYSPPSCTFPLCTFG